MNRGLGEIVASTSSDDVVSGNTEIHADLSHGQSEDHIFLFVAVSTTNARGETSLAGRCTTLTPLIHYHLSPQT